MLATYLRTMKNQTEGLSSQQTEALVGDSFFWEKDILRHRREEGQADMPGYPQALNYKAL